MRFPLRAAAVAVALALSAAPPVRAGSITYTFTSDTSTSGGSLTGSFRVEEADLLDGILSTADVQDYAFTFTDSSGGTTLYVLSGVFPDLAVAPLTGIPLGSSATVLGDQVGESGAAVVSLSDLALAPAESAWSASRQPTGENDSGLGHWEIVPAAGSAVPEPAGAVLGLVGAGCLAAVRRVRCRRGDAG